ncbi:hypothetical protein [Bacillus cereus]|uniref:DUF4365 domain-containing protein n=1 Tax=Bacillus cereus TaxID=1396 RepID=A0A5B9HVY8_BACCE|nr:hypothetical protein [Bacillus cereus]QEF20277.1 hypothetical protein FRY47_28690 [Bacillus cereus]
MSKIESVYWGTGFEYIVMGDFLTRGYEAQKLVPDFGYDILVTNKLKLLNQKHEEPFQYYIQVKSRLVLKEFDNGIINFYIESDFFDKLINDTNGILVCCYVSGRILKDSWSSDPTDGVDWNAMGLAKVIQEINKSIYHKYQLENHIWLNNCDLKYLHENNYTFKKFLHEGISYTGIKTNYLTNEIINCNNEGHYINPTRHDFVHLTDNLGWRHDGLFL